MEESSLRRGFLMVLNYGVLELFENEFVDLEKG